MSLKLDLQKSLVLNLEKAGIFNPPVLETRGAIDVSISMEDLFGNGFVSQTIDRLIVAAMKFDDNQSLELASFDDTFEFTAEATEKDVGVYLSNNPGFFRQGSTKYLGIIREMESRLDLNTKIRENAPGTTGFFKGLLNMFASSEPKSYNFKRTAPHRAYVAAITDGANQDRAEFLEAMENTSGDTFYQFIGLGGSVNPAYLRSIEKVYPHVAFALIKDPTKITDDQFYEIVCNPKFAAWCNAQ